MLMNEIIQYHNKNDYNYVVIVVTIISINIVTLVKETKACDDTVFDNGNILPANVIRH